MYSKDKLTGVNCAHDSLKKTLFKIGVKSFNLKSSGLGRQERLFIWKPCPLPLSAQKKHGNI